MPTYRYLCPKCWHEFETQEPMASPTARPCARCGAESQRLISVPAGIIFKGAGFPGNDMKRARNGR